MRIRLCLRKPIAIRRAVGVRGADQDVLGANAGHLRCALGCPARMEIREIGSDDGHPRLAVIQDQRTDRKISLLPSNRMRRTHAAGNRQQRIRRNIADSDSGPNSPA